MIFIIPDSVCPLITSHLIVEVLLIHTSIYIFFHVAFNNLQRALEITRTQKKETY